MKFFLVFTVTVMMMFAAACTADNTGVEPNDSNESANVSDEQAGSKTTETDKEKENEEEPGRPEKEEAITDEELRYTVRESDWTVQPVEEGKENQNVLITIDDAPDTYSLQMAHTLKEKGVPAIFFVNGHFLQDEEGKNHLKEIYDMGFAIGNHTMNHVSLNNVSAEETRQEIEQLNDLVENITGEKPVFFRAPFGINTDESKAVLEENEMIWMNWTYGYDWEEEYMEADALTNIMVNTDLLVHGANLLMHDREWTKEALPHIIDGFKEKGYGFIHPDQIDIN